MLSHKAILSCTLTSKLCVKHAPLDLCKGYSRVPYVLALLNYMSKSRNKCTCSSCGFSLLICHIVVCKSKISRVATMCMDNPCLLTSL